MQRQERLLFHHKKRHMKMTMMMTCVDFPTASFIGYAENIATAAIVVRKFVYKLM